MSPVAFAMASAGGGALGRRVRRGASGKGLMKMEGSRWM
jgi:hypothetical protein